MARLTAELRRQADDSFEKLGEVCDEDSPLTSTPEGRVEVADEKVNSQQHPVKDKTSVNFHSLVSKINIKRNSPRLLSRALSPALPLKGTPIKALLAVAPQGKQGFYSPRLTAARHSATKLPHRHEAVKSSCPFAFTSKLYPASP